MICSWGMSEKLGPVALGERRGEVFLGDELLRSKNYSEATAEAIDREVRELLERSHAEAHRLLTAHKAQAEELARVLLKHETVSGDEVRAIMGGAKLEDLRRPAPPPRAPSPRAADPGGRQAADGKGRREAGDGARGRRTAGSGTRLTFRRRGPGGPAAENGPPGPRRRNAARGIRAEAFGGDECREEFHALGARTLLTDASHPHAPSRGRVVPSRSRSSEQLTS